MSNVKSSYDYIIVGGSIAGVSAARSIREHDASGAILLVTDEDRIPYKRTKISKNLAAGFDRDAFAMESEQWYREKGIDVLVGDPVEAVDAGGHTVQLRGHGSIAHRKLILAMGASPFLPDGFGEQADGSLYVVRTAADVERLEEALAPVRRAIVVGSGVLGIEVVDQLRRLEKEVVLVGSTQYPLGRRLNDELAESLEALLSENGVELVMGTHAYPLTGSGAATKGQSGTAVRRGVSTDQGLREGDVIIVCAGVRPRVELARDAGLEVDRGIVVDEYLTTSHPDIYAAGDVAEHPGGYLSYLWHAAELQGEIAGANAAGEARRHDCPPFRMKCEVFDNYFFSMNMPSSEKGYEIVPERDGRLYRCLYYRDGSLQAVLMANDKERAKLYVRAVREGWSRSAVDRELPLRALA